ncbi:hypothetical protein J6590_037180 [Homalodisca vitripennis]|nr:hypothetical protein J6590_037180 [Homalodisca vitripennis]
MEPPRSTSYDPDMDDLLDQGDEVASVTVGGDEIDSQSSSISSHEGGPVVGSRGTSQEEDVVTIDTCSQVYFAGYIAHSSCLTRKKSFHKYEYSANALIISSYYLNRIILDHYKNPTDLESQGSVSKQGFERKPSAGPTDSDSFSTTVQSAHEVATQGSSETVRELPSPLSSPLWPSQFSLWRERYVYIPYYSVVESSRLQLCARTRHRLTRVACTSYSAYVTTPPHPFPSIPSTASNRLLQHTDEPFVMNTPPRDNGISCGVQCELLLCSHNPCSFYSVCSASLDVTRFGLHPDPS